MKSCDWEPVYVIGVVSTLLFCGFGFFEMNRELLFEHIARSPPPANWFSGLGMFLVGTISFVLTSYVSVKKLTTKPFIVMIIQLVFLYAILILVFAIIGLYPPNNII